MNAVLGRAGEAVEVGVALRGWFAGNSHHCGAWPDRSMRGRTGDARAASTSRSGDKARLAVSAWALGAAMVD